jgi:urease accessory protein
LVDKRGLSRSDWTGDADAKRFHVSDYNDVDLALLQLMHLSDSALPIGSAAHSFGMETLVEDGALEACNFGEFLHAWLDESGAMEAWFCRAIQRDASRWDALHAELSAAKTARESREASLALGHRFLGLAHAVMAFKGPQAGHHALAFGRVGRALGLSPETVTAAYLHQAASGLISAGQRLMPVGQVEAARLLWSLKPQMLRIARQACEDWSCFAHGMDLGSFRHPGLTTRLFIS